MTNKDDADELSYDDEVKSRWFEYTRSNIVSYLSYSNLDEPLKTQAHLEVENLLNDLWECINTEIDVYKTTKMLETKGWSGDDLTYDMVFLAHSELTAIQDEVEKDLPRISFDTTKKIDVDKINEIINALPKTLNEPEKKTTNFSLFDSKPKTTVEVKKVSSSSVSFELPQLNKKQTKNDLN